MEYLVVRAVAALLGAAHRPPLGSRAGLALEEVFHKSKPPNSKSSARLSYTGGSSGSACTSRG